MTKRKSDGAGMALAIVTIFGFIFVYVESALNDGSKTGSVAPDTCIYRSSEG